MVELLGREEESFRFETLAWWLLADEAMVFAGVAVAAVAATVAAAPGDVKIKG